jgi:hypothetical protein
MKEDIGWLIHNMVGHPISEVVFWVIRPFNRDLAVDTAGKIHDFFIPAHKKGTGRG